MHTPLIHDPIFTEAGLISETEVCRILGVRCRHTLVSYHRTKQGMPQRFKIARRVYYKRSDVAAWLASSEHAVTNSEHAA